MSERKKLRVAGYCRTSTESQRGNASIPVQKEAIAALCKVNGWQIVGWFIDESKSGAKIAGREQFQQMMRDAANGKFDLVVVFDVSRFGRDGRDIINSAWTLSHDFGVHVVDTKGGLDTRNRRRLTSYVNAGLAEDERLNILERTKNAKIAQAREWGAPAVSKKSWPFGRTWVRAARRESGKPIGTWQVDPDAKAMLEDIAERYLAGESFATFADEYGWHETTLHRVLTKRCGDKWTQRIRCKELGIDETIVCTIPPLLDDDTINAVLAEIEARKTYKHPHVANRYLLTGLAHCEYCGYRFSGQPDRGIRIYRHHPDTRPRKEPCPRPKPRPWVRADDLEINVFRTLFDLFGNPDAVRRAVEAAVPNRDEVGKKRERLDRIDAELAAIQQGRDNLKGLVRSGALSPAEVEADLLQSKAKAERLRERRDRLAAELENVLTPEQAKELSERIGKQVRPAGRKPLSGKAWAERQTINRDFDSMTWGEKRALAETVFGGTMTDGRPMGVYLSWDDQNRWRFTLRGHFTDDHAYSPMPKEVWDQVEPMGGSRQHRLAGLAVQSPQSYSRCPGPCSRGRGR